MPIQTSFTVPVKGIGRKDYTAKVERSTATLYNPSLKQEVFIMRYAGVLYTVPFPSIYLFAIPLPQEDGTWGYEASSIVMHFMEMSFTIRSSSLTQVGLLRFASLDDFYDFYFSGEIYANVGLYNGELYPQMYGYTSTKLSYTKGIPTQPGSMYVVVGGFWSSSMAEEVSMVCNGLITNLTREWMS